MSNQDDDAMDSITLAPLERDTICEMTSIAMGAAGSTLSLLLGQEVEVPTPNMAEYATLPEMDVPFGDDPKMLLTVNYNQGIEATALFIIRDADARRLAGSMLGQAESADGEPLSEMESSALGELANQMMNSAATGLASLVHEPVEISNLQVTPYSSDALAEAQPLLLSEPFIVMKIQMKLAEGEPIDLLELRIQSEIKTHVTKLMAIQPDHGSDMESSMSENTSLDDLMASISEPEMATAGVGGGSRGLGSGKTATIDPVTVRPVEFASFDQQPHIYGEENKNLALVMDVHLNLSVELGKTDLSIKDVLELTRGSVIELDRVAGEPVDLMANGKLIAKGEVVVIEDNFGLRITSIISPAERLRGLQ
jgi:flagellar motor switch protein FliN/FliY